MTEAFEERDFSARLLGRTLQTVQISVERIKQDGSRQPGFTYSQWGAQLGTARELTNLGYPGPGMVIAKTMVEVHFQEAMSALFDVRGIAVLDTAVRGLVRGNYSLERDEHRVLYTALSEDTLQSAPFWGAYVGGRKKRNAFVHTGEHVESNDAADFIMAVADLGEHVERVLSKRGVPQQEVIVTDSGQQPDGRLFISIAKPGAGVVGHSINSSEFFLANPHHPGPPTEGELLTG